MNPKPLSLHTYHDGRPYRAPWSSVLPSPYIGRRSLTPCIAIPGPQLDWPDLWTAVQHELRRARFADSTLRLYRRILRTFRTFATQHPHPALRAERPCDVRKAVVEAFIHHINRNRASGSWLSGNIAVLRTVFDKLAGFTVTARLRTPRRPWRLPEFISPEEASRLIQAAGTLRDRLLIGFLYGCGLKVGEVCALRWQDIDVEQNLATVLYGRGTRTRRVPIPGALIDVLKLGREQCPGPDYVFPGAAPGKPLSARLIERMVRRTAAEAGLENIVTCMTLRHSYAVDCLRHGMSPVQLQKNLGHRNLATTLDYQRCLLPDDIVSPLDSLDPIHASASQSSHSDRSAFGVERSIFDVGCSGRSSPLDNPPLPLSLPPQSGEPRTPNPCSTPTMNLEPGTLRPISFPFPAIASGPRQFLTMLRTRLRDRFLALRSSRSPMPIVERSRAALRSFIGNTS
jgi:site-specific recombinase XerD